MQACEPPVCSLVTLQQAEGQFKPAAASSLYRGIFPDFWIFQNQTWAMGCLRKLSKTPFEYTSVYSAHTSRKYTVFMFLYYITCTYIVKNFSEYKNTKNSNRKNDQHEIWGFQPYIGFQDQGPRSEAQIASKWKTTVAWALSVWCPFKACICTRQNDGRWLSPAADRESLSRFVFWIWLVSA